MEKRIIIAIALSLLVTIAWSAFVAKMQPSVPQGVGINESATSLEAPAIEPPQLKEAPESITSTPSFKPSSLIFAQDNLEAIFIEQTAAIQEVKFKSLQNYSLVLGEGFMLDDPSLIFKKADSLSNELIFMHRDETKLIIKKFIFHNSNYDIELAIKITNLSDSPLTLSYPILLGELDLAGRDINARYKDAFIFSNEKGSHVSARKDASYDNVDFIGIRERYLCAIIEPEDDNNRAFINKISPKTSKIGLESKEIIVMPGQSIERQFHIYLGPQDLQTINNIRPKWAGIINYGFFDFISQILLRLLYFLYAIFHNWGFAIVLLSCIVYLLLLPLSMKQMKSVKEMQALQPHIEELRQLHKDNPQKLNKEIMELYREHKVNPFGGCLPLILQMPIFFALYQALMRSVVLKGASFLWIKDLSEPDRLFVLSNSLPILGNEINLLPILMAIGMFVQQKTSAISSGSGSGEQQKLMVIIFPVMFGIIFYHMPSGLVLYWFINSTLMLLYQLKLKQSK